MEVLELPNGPFLCLVEMAVTRQHIQLSLEVEHPVFGMVFVGLSGEVSPRVVDIPEGYDTLVMEACSLLADAGCHFRAYGFGDDHWPVDVAYDFSTVMEQVSETLVAIRSSKPAAIDLYGQGMERTLQFEPQRQGVVEVKCFSRTSWVPNPELEYVSVEYLESVFVALCDGFVRAVARVAPDLVKSEPLARWIAGDI